MGQSVSVAKAFEEFSRWSSIDVEDLQKKYFLMDLNFGVGLKDLKEWLGFDTDSCKSIMAAFNGGKFETISALNLLCGLVVAADGSVDHKMSVIFSCFDFDDDSMLTKDEVAVLFIASLNGISVVTDVDVLSESERIDALVSEVMTGDFLSLTDFKKYMGNKVSDLERASVQKLLESLKLCAQETQAKEDISNDGNNTNDTENEQTNGDANEESSVVQATPNKETTNANDGDDTNDTENEKTNGVANEESSVVQDTPNKETTNSNDEIDNVESGANEGSEENPSNSTETSPDQQNINEETNDDNKDVSGEAVDVSTTSPDVEDKDKEQAPKTETQKSELETKSESESTETQELATKTETNNDAKGNETLEGSQNVTGLE